MYGLQRRTFTFLAILTILMTSRAQAARRPSFSLNDSVCHATDIVLATEGPKIDGELEVLESWKGDTTPGSIIKVPELSEFADEAKRRIHGWNQTDLPEPYVRSVTGSNMVLFLVKKVPLTEQNESDTNDRIWRPATQFGNFQVSVAWVERGEVYVYRQTINPGPTRLEHWGTAISMKATIAGFVTLLTDLDMAVKEADPIRATQVLDACKERRFYDGIQASLDAMAAMGPRALPTFRQLLNNRDYAPMNDKILNAMVKAGGPAVTDDLLQTINEALTYWSQQAPDLAKGWWNAEPVHQRAQRRAEYSELLQALRHLQDLPCDETCRDTIAKTLELWKTTPVLDDVGDSQIVKACTAILEK